MKNIIYLLTIVSLLWYTSASAQSYGAPGTFTQDEFVFNSDLSNNWSALRLQTSNNQAWSMVNKEGLKWFYIAGGNFADRGEASGSKMLLTTSGNLSIPGSMTTYGVSINAATVLELGAGIAGKGAYSGKIGYQTWSDGLDIVGASQGSDGRKITMYADGGLQMYGFAHFTGAIDAPDLTVNSNGVLQLGAGISGRETNAGKIVYQGLSVDGLDIAGAGTSDTNRKINLYSEGGLKVFGGATVTGVVNSLAVSTNAIRVNNNSSVELGYGITKDAASGRIIYQGYSDALDMLGAGTLTTNRKIKLWSEGGLSIVGPTTVAGATDIGGLVRIAPSGTTSFKTIDSPLSGKYLLWVEKGIVGEDVSVAPKAEWIGSVEKQKTIEDAHWADYVFSPSYNLPSLPEVEKYISKNHHLEGIPTAADIMLKGYSLADMDKNFVEKIEELTLYAIQQDKKIAEMEKLLLELKAEIAKKK